MGNLKFNLRNQITSSLIASSLRPRSQWRKAWGSFEVDSTEGHRQGACFFKLPLRPNVDHVSCATASRGASNYVHIGLCIIWYHGYEYELQPWQVESANRRLTGYKQTCAIEATERCQRLVSPSAPRCIALLPCLLPCAACVNTHVSLVPGPELCPFWQLRRVQLGSLLATHTCGSLPKEQALTNGLLSKLLEVDRMLDAKPIELSYHLHDARMLW